MLVKNCLVMEKCVFFVIFTVLLSAVAPNVIIPRMSKQYRSDYVYNHETDAFYKLHIETRDHWLISAVCKIEGAELMSPSSDHDIVQLHSMFKKFPDLGEYVWVADDGKEHESAEEQPLIDLSAVAPNVIIPRMSKQYRSDYVYNHETDAFYKLHIETRDHWLISAVCKIEGAELMSPSSDHDIVQLHSMFKKFPDLGEYVWVADDGKEHESAEEQPLIDLNAGIKNNGLPGFNPCVVVNRRGEEETVPCFRSFPFICKVKAADAPYDSHCDIYGRGYKYFASTGSCYKINGERYTWSEAYSECKAEGANLVVLNSEIEHDVVQNFTTAERITWYMYLHAGFRADKPARNQNTTPTPRVFKTVFNQTLEEAGYSLWSPPEPNNLNGNEYCGSIYQLDGKFNDIDCDELRPFICEKEVKRV